MCFKRVMLMDSMMEGVGKGSVDDSKRELFLVRGVLCVFNGH